MVKAMYSGVSGLRAHQSKMDVIGNNIANVSTWGYKAMTTSFKESVYQTMINSSTGGTGDGSYGGVNPSVIGYGSMVSAISSNFTAGNQVYTGQGLDCFIEGTSFFAVGPIFNNGTTKMKPDDLNLSRVGNLGIVNGYLVDGNGRYIYGFNVSKAAGGTDGITSENIEDPANPGQFLGPQLEGYTYDAAKGTYSFGVAGVTPTEMRPIKLPTKLAGPPETELKLKGFSIEADGKLYGIDINTDKKVLLGNVGLVNVQNPNGLAKADGPYYKTGGSTGDSTIVAPGGTTGKILANYLESANVDIAQEFSEMITTQRGFQANSKIITVTDEMLQELVNMKR